MNLKEIYQEAWKNVLHLFDMSLFARYVAANVSTPAQHYAIYTDSLYQALSSNGKPVKLIVPSNKNTVTSKTALEFSDRYKNDTFCNIPVEAYPAIESLIDKGLMFNSNRGWKDVPDSSYFHVTDEAIELMRNYMKDKLKKEKPSRSKRRYQMYRLSESDETFGEWLKNSYWDDYRKRHDC